MGARACRELPALHTGPMHTQNFPRLTHRPGPHFSPPGLSAPTQQRCSTASIQLPTHPGTHGHTAWPGLSLAPGRCPMPGAEAAPVSPAALLLVGTVGRVLAARPFPVGLGGAPSPQGAAGPSWHPDNRPYLSTHPQHNPQPNASNKNYPITFDS